MRIRNKITTLLNYNGITNGLSISDKGYDTLHSGRFLRNLVNFTISEMFFLLLPHDLHLQFEVQSCPLTQHEHLRLLHNNLP